MDLFTLADDAHHYRFGEAYDLDDPDLDPYDREQVIAQDAYLARVRALLARYDAAAYQHELAHLAHEFAALIRGTESP